MSRRQEARSGATPTTQSRVPSAPSQTITETPSQPQPQQTTSRILRLRGARNTNGRSVQWAEDVVDNEGLGRKSSKVCCIYHRPKAVDESSDESSSDSDVSSGDEDGNHADRKGKDHKCGGPGHSHGSGKKGEKSKKRAPSPNAYEKVPKVKPKEESANKG